MYPMIDTIRTGKKIKYYMDCHQLTPKDIQDYLSLTCVQTVYRWLNGNTIPNVDNLYALSELFKVSMDDIVQGNRSPYSPCYIKETNTHYGYY